MATYLSSTKMAELPQLLDFRPFDPVEFLPVTGSYDFHNNCSMSFKKFLYDQLSQQHGAHDAVRILNYERNFKRDYRSILSNCDLSSVKDRLQVSYLEGLRRFFSGQTGDLLLEQVS